MLGSLFDVSESTHGLNMVANVHAPRLMSVSKTLGIFFFLHGSLKKEADYRVLTEYQVLCRYCWQSTYSCLHDAHAGMPHLRSVQCSATCSAQKHTTAVSPITTEYTECVRSTLMQSTHLLRTDYGSLVPDYGLHHKRLLSPALF